MWLQRDFIDFADGDLESQVDVGGVVYAGIKKSWLILAVPKILTAVPKAIQFSFGDSARQVFSVHRKLQKSWIEKTTARGPGIISRYHKISMANGTSGRSSNDAKTNPAAFNRPLAM
jgi:hypothetical protein